MQQSMGVASMGEQAGAWGPAHPVTAKQLSSCMCTTHLQLLDRAHRVHVAVGDKEEDGPVIALELVYVHCLQEPVELAAVQKHDEVVLIGSKLHDYRQAHARTEWLCPVILLFDL